MELMLYSIQFIEKDNSSFLFSIQYLFLHIYPKICAFIPTASFLYKNPSSKFELLDPRVSLLRLVQILDEKRDEASFSQIFIESPFFLFFSVFSNELRDGKVFFSNEPLKRIVYSVLNLESSSPEKKEEIFFGTGILHIHCARKRERVMECGSRKQR